MGLQKKIFIYVGAGLVVLIVLLTWLFLQTINQGIDMVRQERLALIEDIALETDNLIKHLRTETINSASSLGWGWEDELTDFHKEQLAFARYDLQQHLLSFHQIEQAVFVALLDAQGKVLWTEPYLAQKVNQYLDDIPTIRDVFQKGQVFIEVEETLLTQDSPTLSLVVPLKYNHEAVRGVFIADMPGFPSNMAFRFLLRSQETNYDLELVSGSGLVLASPTPGQAIEESPHWEVIRQLAQERLPGIEEHPADKEKEAHVVVFAPLAQVPWGVVLEQSKEEVLVLPWTGSRPLMVGGLVVLLAAGLMWIVTRQIVSPLRRLAATAQRFGSGDLEASIPAMGRDEIGRLAESLDTMRHQLKHSLDEIKRWNQELEQRVKQRTNELEELSQQLSERDKERSDLLGKIITAQEEERRRIARELHDEVSQTLTGLVMSLGSAEALLVRDPAARKRLESLRGLTSEAVDEVRRLIQDLRPSLLDDLGLVAAIGWYVENYLAPAGVKAELETPGFDRRLPPTVEITLFRVVQEAITNIIKHAQAKKAYIRLQFTRSAIKGSIEDDGVGFNVDTLHRQRPRGMAVGLLGMEERISLLEGKLNIESQPGGGTHVYFEIPWQEGNGEKNSRSDS